MNKLRINHSIALALSRTKMSVDLASAFLEHLANSPEWLNEQAAYLMETGRPIESIVEELFDVPLKEQENWVGGEESIGFEEEDDTLPPPPEESGVDFSEAQIEFQPKTYFSDWKQQHGFDSIPIEIGDVHTFLRFRQIISSDQEEKFIWYFNRSRYGKRGWGNERPIKSISKSLMDNNNAPGWVVHRFLEENKMLTDEYHVLRESGEIPNPLVLSSRDSHALFILLLGHPFLFYDDSFVPIRNSYLQVHYQINVHSNVNHKILAGNFYHIDKEGNRLPIVTEDFIDNGFMFYGLPKAIVYDNKYYQIASTRVPAKMIRDSFKGVLISNGEWDEFYNNWQSFFPEDELNFVDAETTETPNFIARNVKNWRYWIAEPEINVKLFPSEKDIVWLRLHEENKNIFGNRLALDIENFDPEAVSQCNSNKCPKTSKLFQVLQVIIQEKKKYEYYNLERHGASQLLILAEEYPYARGLSDEHILGSEKLDFRITVIRNPENTRQYLLQGEIFGQNENEEKKVISGDGITKQKAIGLVPSYWFLQRHLARIGSMYSGILINELVSGVIVEETEISEFYSTALPYLRQRSVRINDPQGLLRVSALFNYRITGEMTIWEVKGILMGRLKPVMHTDIGDFDYPLGLNADEFELELDGRRFKIPKNARQEQIIREEIYEAGWIDEGENEYAMREEHTLHFILEILPKQTDEDHIKYLGGKKLRRWKTKKVIPAVSTSIQTGIDWFDVDIKLSLEGKEIDLEKLIDLWKSGSQAMELPDDEGVAVIDKDWISRFAPMLNRLLQTSKQNAEKKTEKEIVEEIEQAKQETENTLKVDKFQAGLLSELEMVAEEAISDEGWKTLLSQASSFGGIKKQIIPSTVKAKLRGYQKDGVNWIAFLREYGFGGILADDMGLGKTLQALAFMAIEKKNGLKKPSLVIAPTSVVTNWMAEISKFVPHLKAVLLHGQKRKELFNKAKKADIIITTYGLLQRDIDWLASLDYHLVILDEAQMIKNARSKTALAVGQLKSIQRLTLTGTPIENSASELWSQFNFLMPGFLGSLKDFERDYVRQVFQGRKKKTDFGLLRRQTRPFILRRMKQDVAKELPPKTEQTLYCEMGDQQRSLYNSVLEIVRQKVRDKIQTNGLKSAQISIFDALLKLRQICCDPRLSVLSGDNPPASAKMSLFMDTLTNIVEEGHRVLVFSQFVKMLKLMHGELESRNIPFLQLDGSTRNRETLVEKFQRGDEYPVFLISLKAGGTGINLTAADYVIHFDPWWNPAAEAQATDRAYRIGQVNHLFVYKLITRDSIEEKILELQSKKLALANQLVNVSPELDKMIDKEDLTELLGI